MRLLIFFLFSIFFSTNILAYDFSGLYEGKQCTRMCKDKSQVDKFFESLPVLGSLKGDNKSYTVLYVEHDEKANKISIFAPKLDYLFGNMSLTGNFFKGYATNKSNNQNTIEGNISKGSIDITIYKAATDSTYNIVAKLSDRDVNYNDLKEQYADLQKDLKNSENNNTDKKSDISNLNKTIDNKETQIAKLKDDKEKQIAKLEKERNDLETKLNNDIDLLKKTLDKLKKKPPEINVSPIEMTDKISCDGLNLRSVNSDNAKKYSTLNKDKKVRLLSITDGIWALIITEDGLIGYALNSCINSLDDVAVVQPVATGPNAINVYEPCKVLKSNEACNIDGSGIVTVQGTINLDKIKAVEVLVNDEIADLDSAGNFETILFDIEAGNNDITISAMDSEGKRKELSFVISAN